MLIRSFDNLFHKSLLFGLIISLSGLSVLFSYQRYVTYGLMPIILIYTIFKNGLQSFGLREINSKLFLSIIGLSLMLYFFLPMNQSSALDNIIKLFGVYVCILLTIETLSIRTIDFFLVFFYSFIAGFVIMAFYLLKSSSSIDIVSGEYINRSGFDLNANMYSYLSFFACISSFYLIELKRNKFNHILLSVFTSLLGVYISFYTSSRSGIVFVASATILYWLFIYKGRDMNPLYRIGIISFLFLIALYQVLKIYMNSYLKFRVDESVSDGDSRFDLIDGAFTVFMENSFFGVGPGQYYLYSLNSRSFSHNSFAEISANLGIIGLVLIVSIFFGPVLKSLRMLLSGKYRGMLNIIKLNMLFFIFFILYNNLYVFYLTTFGMIFFVLIVILQNRIQFRNIQ